MLELKNAAMDVFFERNGRADRNCCFGDVGFAHGFTAKMGYVLIIGILRNQPKVVYTFRGTIAPSVRTVRLAISS